MSRAQVHRLGTGRLHLHDGPIDLVVFAEGRAVAEAEAAAIARFRTILDELCAELPLLRRQPQERPSGAVARRMWQATQPFARETFITPMAAVAGSVAEEVLDAMCAATPLARAFVNNGGDIAMHLAPGQSCRVGLVDRPDAPSLFANAAVRATDPVRGIATSGWRGRSFSLGIADAVTVLAQTASLADAAATLIANAVDCPGLEGVSLKPARDLQPDSDLGDRLVTVAVPRLARSMAEAALQRGQDCAEQFRKRGLIQACALHLQGLTRTIGHQSQELAHA